MEKLIIEGIRKLSGEVSTSGSKNSALALMSASTLASQGVTRLSRIPDVLDVHTLAKLLEELGATTSFNNSVLTIDARSISNFEASYNLVKKMRASIYLLGPLLSRFGRAKISFPGGCAFGPRPIDLHLDAMKKLGANITFDGGYIFAATKNNQKLKGGKIKFKLVSVGATGNTIMAATLAKGTTLISNIAREPEISALCSFLQKMGAKIYPINKTTLEIQGVDELSATKEENIGDRIEAGTILVAAAITGGKVKLLGIDPTTMTTVLKKLVSSGCSIETTKDSISLEAPKILHPTHISAKPYPSFPTDLQAQWTSLMTQAEGTSRIADHVYFERFKHVPELNRMGAGIEIKKNYATVRGIRSLKGAPVMSTDLRASACLVLAGLAAEGITEVTRIYHIDRGYQKIEEKLNCLGASIIRKHT